MVFGVSLINGDIYISPRLTPIAMATKFGCKIGYSSVCVRDFCQIFGPICSCTGMGHRMPPIAFPPTDPHCHNNEIRDKILYNSACVRDICEIFCICGGGFGNGPSNAAN